MNRTEQAPKRPEIGPIKHMIATATDPDPEGVVMLADALRLWADYCAIYRRYGVKNLATTQQAAIVLTALHGANPGYDLEILCGMKWKPIVAQKLLP